MKKESVMEQLKSESREVHDRTCDPDTNTVWGEGNLDSRLVLVGEAPGAQEDKEGRPFVGAAGQLLDRELELAGIPRDQVYITNVVKCRPVQVQAGRKSNRAPTAKETQAWRALLMREIETISPRVVLCLGAVAASALIHSGFGMKAERGKWFDGPLNTKAMATFHPAYLVRARQYGSEEPLGQFREDLNDVRRAVEGG